MDSINFFYGPLFLALTVVFFIIAWVKVLRNKARRAQAEDVIRESEKKYRSLFENNPLPLWIHDADTLRFIEVNDAAVRHFGYSRHEFLTMTVKDIRLPEEVSLLTNRELSGYAPAIDAGGIWRCLRKDETVIFVETALNALTFAGKQARLVLAHDVTQRTAIEEALRRSEERFRSLFNLASDAIFLLDPLHKGAPLIIDANIAACTIHGYTREEMIGKPITFIDHPDTAKIIPDVVNRLLAGETTTFEIDHVRRDGSVFPVEVSAQFIVSDRPFILAVDRDITRRKRAEGELQKHREHLEELVREGTAELREINEELEKEIRERRSAEKELRVSQSQLRDLSSHLQGLLEIERTKIAREIHDELGQTLTALKIDVSWIRNKFAEHPLLFEKTATMLHLLDSTIKTVKRLSADLRPGVLDDLGLIAAIEWHAEEFEKRTGITCNIRFSPEDIILDKGRSTTIFRIFQEALTNTMRHAQATRVDVSLEEKGRNVILRITDNGKGISEAQMAKPQSFGLIGMKERVRYLHGTLEIEGVQGRGTSVTVTLPLEKENETEP